MEKETLWTCTAICKECGAVINTAEHVPESKKARVSMSAPMVAFCQQSDHNTLSDLNYHFRLEWVAEPD